MSKSVLLTEEVRELVHYKPHWIIRRGNSFFLLLLVLVLAASWFIRIPDGVGGAMITRVKDGEYEGLMTVSRVDAGKIKAGERVVMYRGAGAGSISGRVQFISGIPGTKDSFLVEVRFPAGLEKEYSAPAEVATGNRRLFDRLFEGFERIIPGRSGSLR